MQKRERGKKQFVTKTFFYYRPYITNNMLWFENFIEIHSLKMPCTRTKFFFYSIKFHFVWIVRWLFIHVLMFGSSTLHSTTNYFHNWACFFCGAVLLQCYSMDVATAATTVEWIINICTKNKKQKHMLKSFKIVSKDQQ